MHSKILLAFAAIVTGALALVRPFDGVSMLSSSFSRATEHSLACSAAHDPRPAYPCRQYAQPNPYDCVHDPDVHGVSGARELYDG